MPSERSTSELESHLEQPEEEPGDESESDVSSGECGRPVSTLRRSAHPPVPAPRRSTWARGPP